MKDKNLNFGKSIADKIKQTKDQENDHSKTDSSAPSFDNAISKIASNKDEAMKEFNLKPITIGGKYDLEGEEDITLTILAKKLSGGIKQELASRYVREGIKRDAKKYNIPIIK